MQRALSHCVFSNINKLERAQTLHYNFKIYKLFRFLKAYLHLTVNFVLIFLLADFISAFHKMFIVFCKFVQSWLQYYSYSLSDGAYSSSVDSSEVYFFDRRVFLFLILLLALLLLLLIVLRRVFLAGCRNFS